MITRNAHFWMLNYKTGEIEEIYAPVANMVTIACGDVVLVKYDHNGPVEVMVWEKEYEVEVPDLDEGEDTYPMPAPTPDTDTDDEVEEPETISVYVSDPDNIVYYHLNNSCEKFTENNREPHLVEVEEIPSEWIPCSICGSVAE